MDLSSAIFIAAILNFSLGFFVWRTDPSSKLNRAYALMALVIGVWVLINFLLQKFAGVILFKFSLAIGPFVLISIINWLIRVHRESFSAAYRWFFGLLLVSSVIPTFLVFYGQLSVSSVVSATQVTLGPFFSVFAIYLGILIGALLIQLLVTYFGIAKEKRKQLKLAAIGLAIFILLALVFDVVFPLLGQNHLVMLDTPSSLIFVLFTAYAIVSGNLFEVKLLATQFLVSSLTLILVSQAIFARTLPEKIINFLIAIISGYLGYLLTQAVVKEMKRSRQMEELAEQRQEALGEVAERNKNLATLQRISDIVLNETEMKAMTQRILDELPVQLPNCIGGFLSVIREGKLTAFSVSSTQFADKIEQLIGKDLDGYAHPITKEFNKLHEAVVTKKVLHSENLSDFISPPIGRPVALTLQRLIGARHLEAFPLYAGGQPFGTLLFLFSSAEEKTHSQNFEIAKSIADNMSLAIQRAEAFQQLKDANQYLSELDKMKDEFISMASHELNTPLAAIEGYLSMIVDEHMGKVDAKSKVYITRAYESSKRLADLVLDLLNVSRVEQGRLKLKFSQINLADLAQSVVHELQLKASAKKIYLKLDMDKSKIPVLWCDPDRIREVLVNLTGNAIKFTDKGGVTIKIEKVDAGTVRCSVIDTGRGIAKEDQKKLFQKFSQIKREVDEHQGTGLGLYISKNFIQLHHGKLSVESDAGKGATFSFELPVIKEAPKEIEGAILEGPLSLPKIVPGTKEVPAIITDSAKRN